MGLMHSDGIYKSQLPVRALMNELESIENLDKESEKKISFWGKIRILLFVLGAISLLLGKSILETLFFHKLTCNFRRIDTR